MDTAICNVCGFKKPLSPEFWHKQAKNQSGLSETCKDCAKRRAREWYAANRERHRAAAKKWRAENPEYRKLVEYPNNREKILTYQREYYAENAEYVKARARAYAEANPEKIAERNRAAYWADPEKSRAQVRAWKRANVEKVKAAIGRYRANRKKAPGRFTADDVAALFLAQNGRCRYCGQRIDERFEVDHWIPLSKGGTNYPENLVLACPSCNASKRNRMPEEFLKTRG